MIMAKKPTFTLRTRTGDAIETPYTPLLVIAGSTAHKLALHRDSLGDWVVSDPRSGAAVIRRMTGWYKGCPVSLKAYTLKQAQAIALHEVEALIEKIGSDKFNRVLANPKPF
jgi:hypothetical protein